MLIGVMPGLLYAYLPFAVDYAPYTARHVAATLGLLGFTALGFFLLLKQLDPEPSVSLDTDWFYRRAARATTRLAEGPLARLEYGVVGEVYEFVMRRPILGVAAALRELDSRVVDGAVNGVGRWTESLSWALRPVQSGHAQHYGLLMAIGVLAAIVVAVLR